MIDYRESHISAHHNYLVNGMLTPGFVVGDPNAREGFYFLADLVLPGESHHSIHARLCDEKGRLLVEIRWNRLGSNPYGCTYRSVPGGFGILTPEGGTVIEVTTVELTNGYLTTINGTLYDERGEVRMESDGDGITVRGPARPALETPFRFASP